MCPEGLLLSWGGALSGHAGALRRSHAQLHPRGVPHRLSALPSFSRRPGGLLSQRESPRRCPASWSCGRAQVALCPGQQPKAHCLQPRGPWRPRRGTSSRRLATLRVIRAQSHMVPRRSSGPGHPCRWAVAPCLLLPCPQPTLSPGGAESPGPQGDPVASLPPLLPGSHPLPQDIPRRPLHTLSNGLCHGL